MFGDNSSAGLRVSEMPCSTAFTLHLIVHSAINHHAAHPCRKNKAPVCYRTPKVSGAGASGRVPKGLGFADQTGALLDGAHCANTRAAQVYISHSINSADLTSTVQPENAEQQC